MKTLKEVQDYLNAIEDRLNYRIEIIDVTATGFKLETNYDFSGKEEIKFPTNIEILDAEIASLEEKAHDLEDYYEWMDSCHD